MASDPKPIIPSDHTEDRMKARTISLNQLVVAIRKPTRRMAGNTHYTERLERDYPNGRILSVVIEEQPLCIRVVTTYWVGE